MKRTRFYLKFLSFSEQGLITLKEENCELPFLPGTCLKDVIYNPNKYSKHMEFMEHITTAQYL